jgi:hypothetical protein
LVGIDRQAGAEVLAVEIQPRSLICADAGLELKLQDDPAMGEAIDGGMERSVRKRSCG